MLRSAKPLSHLGWDRRTWARIGLALAAGAAAFTLWWHVLGAHADRSSVAVLGALTVGVNVIIWTCAGGLRWIDETLGGKRPERHSAFEARVSRDAASRGEWGSRAGGKFAILIPACNEETVISRSVASATRSVSPRHVYVVSDGSTDQTVPIATAADVNVLQVTPRRGKPAAIDRAVEHFRLTDRYQAVLFLAAKSELDPAYLERLRPLVAHRGIRAASGRPPRFSATDARVGGDGASRDKWNRTEHGEFAILIPAYNEEKVISRSIASATRSVSPRHVYVVSDGSTDQTVPIASAAEVNVLQATPNRGKAAAIEHAIEHFRLTDRYEAVLFLDADSELDPAYLERVRPLLADPGVAAVAGYAISMWEPRRMSLVGQLIGAYRDRLYTLQQHLYKFGQAWHRLNVAYIAPGFASVYRSRALRAITLNPPGLAVEDFNMTFQVHRRRLGRIAFSPRIQAVAQDPHTLHDYIHQVRRWNLGFWQTVKYNGVWRSLFWLALAVVIAESMLVNLAILGALALAIALALPPLTDGAVLHWGTYSAAYTTLETYLTLPMLAAAVLIPDYLLTCAVAAIRRRPRYLLLGLGFMLLRIIDAALAIWALPQAWRTTSTGAWRSPARR